MAPAGIGDRVEGLHAVEAAARAGRVTDLYADSRATDRAEVEEIIDLVRSYGGRVVAVDDISEIAETAVPQGVVAKARPVATFSLDDVVSRSEPAALIVLDHLEDPQNVGAVARSANASSMSGMVVATRRAAPMGAAAFKAAAGALERLPVVVVNSIADTLERLNEGSVWTVGLDAGGDQSVFGLELLTEPVALVVGSEGRGLGRLVSERVDVRAFIPTGEFTSLNASVAAALAMFEIARVRGTWR